MKAKRAKFVVLTCTGDFVAYVEGDGHPDFEGEPDRSVGYDAARAAGYDVGAKCDGCMDNQYRVEFVEWVKVVPVKRKKRRARSAMDIAAEACGLVKVRGALGGIYYE